MPASHWAYVSRLQGLALLAQGHNSVPETFGGLPCRVILTRGWLGGSREAAFYWLAPLLRRLRIRLNPQPKSEKQQGGFMYPFTLSKVGVVVVFLSLFVFAQSETYAAALNHSSGSSAEVPAASVSEKLMIGTDMMRPVLYLMDIATDRMITVDLSKDPKWPGGAPLHTVVTPDGTKTYLSVMSSEKDPLTILALRINKVDWKAGTADVRITNVMRVEEPGTSPSMPIPTETDPSQPVTSLWKPSNQQLHGPTVHPSGRFVYFTQWTDNKIRVVDVSSDKVAASDPIQHGTFTRQMHGVFFNPTGTAALGTGYHFDINYVTLYSVDVQSGYLQLQKVIPLTVSEKNKEYAAFSHFVVWLDDRYAITSTQQTGPTSLTPRGFKVVGPSVWLVDAVEGKARMIIGPAKSPEEPGIYKPGSDIMVVRNKLYVAEEDSMDTEMNKSYLSIWDLTNRTAPKFIKRLGSGTGLPDDFDLSHELYLTRDGKHIYLQSWHSAHLVKIDTSSDTVVKVWSKQDGFHMPHGNFIPGNLR